jgi:TRAP-type C4-dicarboxylate transport system substrate-binding protein
MHRLAGAALAALMGVAAQAQEVTLTVHHFLGPSSPTHATLIEPWARRVEAQSGGRIAIEIFPSMTLGGKPPELYRQVRDGVADIVWTLPGYTPGVFPRVEVFELPTVHRGSAEATNAAIQSLMPMLDADFADVKPILVHVHAGNALMLRENAVVALDDVAGLRVRTPSRTGAWVLESWGAEPVGMPIPELPQALARGALDGALAPFEVAPSLKLQDVTKRAVEGPDGRRFGTSVFLFAMNRDRYEALPPDLRAVIDANSGAALAAEIGSAWDAVEREGERIFREAGGVLDRLDAEAMTAFDAAADTVTQRWVAEAAGFDGAALATAAQAAVEEAGK